MVSIYFDEAGRAAVRAWCVDRLDRSGLDGNRRVLQAELGPTHLSEFGAGSRTVLVIPAAGENAATSLPLVRTLVDRYRVIVADVPGEPGLSHDRRPRHDLLQSYGKWITEVVGAATPRPALVCAEGLGATIALSAPVGLVDGLVAIAPAGMNDHTVDLETTFRGLRYEISPTPHNASRLLDRLYGRERAADHDVLVEWVALAGTKAWPSKVPALLPNAVLMRWRDVDHRVLVGEFDSLHRAGRVGKPVNSLMGSEVQAVAGAGNLLTHERPAAVRAALDDLITCSGRMDAVSRV